MYQILYLAFSKAVQGISILKWHMRPLNDIPVWKPAMFNQEKIYNSYMHVIDYIDE